MGINVNLSEGADEHYASLMVDRVPRGEIEEASGEAHRRVISRGVASLVVAIAGSLTLALGLVLLQIAPHPGIIVGEERAVLRFFGIAACTTGTVALCAATLLAASSLSRIAGGKSRAAVGAILLGVIAALSLLD